MRTSENGIAFIQRHEGVVLRAYRDPVGVWTIGAGLTEKSGVVDPSPGMAITREQADDLLARALRLNYEPAVARAMPRAKPHEFDAGVSFHFNTGAIARASWVPAWASGNLPQMRERIKRWNKGGGRVLPGLIRRRGEEADLIEFGDYGAVVSARPPAGLAPVALDLAPDELAATREAFRALGFGVGGDARGIARAAVLAFQRRHDLAVDGILGRATLSTLQRRMDARRQAALGGTVAVGGGAETATNVLPDTAALSWLGPVVLIAGVVFLGWQAWRYRDVLAVKLSKFSPRLAAFLRSLK